MSQRRLRQFVLIALLTVVSMLAFLSAYVTLRPVRKKVNDLNFMLHHPRASYDEKMMWQWGLGYAYMRFIREHTPPDAVLLMPSQGSLCRIMGGSAPRYFLYPRDVRIGSQMDTDLSGEVTHALIFGGIAVSDALPVNLVRDLNQDSYGLWDVQRQEVLWMPPVVVANPYAVGPWTSP